MRRSFANPVNRGYMFRDKTGYFLHIPARYQKLEIIGTGHETQGFPLPEPRKPFCYPVITIIAFRADLEFDDGRNFPIACQLPVDDRSVFSDYPGSLECVYTSLCFARSETGHH